MSEQLDTKRIVVYLTGAYGIAWAVGLIIYLTGGLINSPQLIPGIPITLAFVLMATGYMWSPALAHIISRMVTHEGWQGLWLHPQFSKGWPYLAAAWFLPSVMTILGAVVFFAIFPSYFDPSLGMLKRLLEQTPQSIPFSPWTLVLLQTVQGILLAPLINSLFTFGEEFGWRAYLLPKFLPLGERNALLISGISWGVWHWPVIAMGHNYGLTYPGAPWAGMLAMVWFTVVTGIFLGWATLHGRSVWPAVIGHAAINGISGLPALFTQGQPNPLLGPLPVGLVGSAAWSALALWIMLRRRAQVRHDSP